MPYGQQLKRAVCHKEPCFTIRQQADEAYRQAKPGIYIIAKIGRTG